MKNTILTIEHNNYQENVIVNAKNVKEVRNLIKEAKGFTVAFQGDYSFSLKPLFKMVEVELSNCDRMHKSFTINVEVREDDKIRVLGDSCGDWVFKFQTVKTTGKGDYVKMYGQRVYFSYTAPTYN